MKSKSGITIGIDASNIRSGGGLTHLLELLNHLVPEQNNIRQVIVWSNSNTLNQLPEKSWLSKIKHKFLEGSLIGRIYWQVFFFTSSIIENKCDLVFIPGGSFTTSFRPIISMNQNLLPFEWKELFRYGISLTTLKFILLRLTNQSAFKKSNGIIFLSRYSKDIVLKSLPSNNYSTVIIPHGIQEKFFLEPRKQLSISSYSNIKPIKIIYVSSIECYKHHCNVVEAISRVKRSGYPVMLDIYGTGNAKAVKKLKQSIAIYDKDEEYIIYKDEIAYNNIQEIYFSADLAIFASTCETFGQILLESMAAGLPIACSKYSSMPEIILDAGIYFDPLDVKDIEAVITSLIISEELRTDLSEKAHKLAKNYSWSKTSFTTFKYFKDIVQSKKDF